MKDHYRRELERLGPGQEELERLYTMIEGGTHMKRKMWIGCRAVAAIAVCIALTITAAAAAVVPGLWEAIKTRLGVFAPYAQTIEGAVCTDQGIEVQVLSALSDDLEARFYLAVRDVEGDRLNRFLTLNGRLTAGVSQDNEEKDPSVVLGAGLPSTRYFDLLSYDPDTKTALLCATIYYGEDAQPSHKAQLSITEMTTQQAELRASISCASATSATLKSLPVGKDDKVIFRPSDVANSGYTDNVLPSQKVVLAPGQTPMPLEGTEDMRVSSMGFASDGCFHIRLEFAEGVRPGLYQDGSSALKFGIYGVAGEDSIRYYAVYQQTLVEGGMDILFPLIKAGDLDAVKGGHLDLDGTYFRPGTDIEGDWSVEFDLEHYSSATLDWNGEIDGSYVRQVSISPLSVIMYSNNTGSFANAELRVVKKDGTTVTAKPGPGRYANLEATGGQGYDAYNTWKFAEPVDVADIVSLTLRGGTIPVSQYGDVKIPDGSAHTTYTANPTNDALDVDGAAQIPTAYKINGANYFQLRDVAMLLNGTSAQFSVDYDEEHQAVKITTGEPYTPQGWELSGSAAQSAEAVQSNNDIYINGTKVDFAVYKINGANFFQIRALGQALGFNVGWTAGRGMFIESDKPYTSAD